MNFSLPPYPLDGQDPGVVVEWLVDRVNALAGTFMAPAQLAQEQKPQSV
jgi:hypothetical protein